MSTPGVMTKFRISELSGVDSPAQKGARAVIMKRAQPTPEEIAAAAALAKQDRSQPHDDEGATAMLKEIAKSLGLPETATEADVTAALAKNAAAAAETTTQLAVLKAKADMTDAEKKQMAGKTDDEVCKFMAKSADERASEIAKAAAGDETVEIDGNTISKRAVGDAQFAIFKSMAKRLTDSEAEIKKAREETETATFTKRAEVDFPHLAGSVENRTLVLKHLAKADEPTRNAAEAILKAAEATSKLAFEKLGHNNGGEGGAGGTEAETKIAKRQDEILKAEPTLTKAQAYTKALRENPALYAELTEDDA